MDSSSTPADDSVLWTIPHPDWAKWERTRNAKLWQAVALLCELDPARLEIGDGKLNTVFINTPAKFTSLLGLAKAGIGAGLLKLDRLDPEQLEESQVDLTVFASWAHGMSLALPQGFPWEPEMNLQITGWPWGRHETDLLRKLARAADLFWKNYQPDQPSTAPTNDQVIKWLVDQKVARRTAEVMATILRADGLPTGPRK